MRKVKLFRFGKFKEFLNSFKCQFSLFFLFFKVFIEILLKKWSVCLFMVAICFPGTGEGNSFTVSEIGSESYHSYFMSIDSGFKNIISTFSNSISIFFTRVVVSSSCSNNLWPPSLIIFIQTPFLIHEYIYKFF